VSTYADRKAMCVTAGHCTRPGCAAPMPPDSLLCEPHRDDHRIRQARTARGRRHWFDELTPSQRRRLGLAEVMP